MKPTVLITRPDPGGVRFADAIHERFGEQMKIVLSPVMKIENVGEMPELSTYRTVVFTSQHGVARFVELTDRRDIAGYAVGDATACAAQNAGLTVASCNGNADDLVARMLTDGVVGPCLHVRGEHSTGDVASTLTASGIETDEVVLYRQVSEPLNAKAQMVLDQDDPLILPLFSPRSAILVAKDGISIGAPLYVVAMSQAVADAMPKFERVDVRVANSPDMTAMLDAVGEAMESAIRVEGRKRPQ